MEKEKKLSIIIPVYNLQDHIEKTLNSIFSQCDEDVEIIIVDDGSVDDSCLIIESIILSYKKSHVNLIKKANGGVSSARNEGIIASRGQYILFFDGDDLFADDAITKILKKISLYSYDVIFWQYDDIDTKGNVVRKYENYYNEPSRLYSRNELLHHILSKKRKQWIWTGSACYKRELIFDNMILFNEKSSYAEDTQFVLSAVSKAQRLFFINDTLTYYVKRPNSLTSKFNYRHFDFYYSIMCLLNVMKSSGVKRKYIRKVKINYFLSLYYGAAIAALQYHYFDEGKGRKANKIMKENIDRINPALRKRVAFITFFSITGEFKLRFKMILLTFFPNTLLTFIIMRKKAR